MKKTLLILVALVLIILVHYAGPFQPLDFREHQVGSVDIEHEKARLMVIGLDDDGNIEDPTAIQKVSDTIAEFRPKLVFLFVHGWRGDGSKENEQEGDLGRYKQFLNQTTDVFDNHPLIRQWRQDRVLGIYVAWHGHARSELSLLSFWNRYDVASKIGENPNIFPQLQTLFHEAHQQSAYRSPVRVVLFAHSMGGQIVNGWLNQLEDPLDLHKQGKMPDLTLIINPAAPTKQYDRFVEQYHSRHKKQKQTPPLIISIASTGDSATRWFYPIGTLETAIGHKHQTHLISPTPQPKTSALCREEDTPFSYNLLCDEFPQTRLFRTRNGYYTIESKEEETSPYWVIRLPPDILADHMSFFDEDFIACTGALFKYSKSYIWKKR